MEKNVFDDFAKRYDNAERNALAHTISNEIKPELAAAQASVLLDYGCGTGLVSLPLAPLVRECLLVDSSTQMLQIAEEKIEQQQISNARVLHADFREELPAINADIVLLSLVLLHVPETSLLLTQIYNLLNEDGKLLIVDFDKNTAVSHPKVHNGFNHQKLIEALTAVGFQRSSIHNFYHGEKIFMNQDADLFLAIGQK